MNDTVQQSRKVRVRACVCVLMSQEGIQSYQRVTDDVINEGTLRKGDNLLHNREREREREREIAYVSILRKATNLSSIAASVTFHSKH